MVEQLVGVYTCAFVCVRQKTEETLCLAQRLPGVCWRQSVSSFPSPSQPQLKALHPSLPFCSPSFSTPSARSYSTQQSSYLFLSAPPLLSPPLPSLRTRHFSPVLPRDTLRICVDSFRSRYFTDATDAALSRVQRDTLRQSLTSRVESAHAPKSRRQAEADTILSGCVEVCCVKVLLVT